MTTSLLRVLLIEDNFPDAILLEEQLSSIDFEKFEITHAVRLEDGLAKLRGGKFDVLVLDLALPDAGGREAFLRVRTEVPQIPVVVLSGSRDQELCIDAIRSGVEDYLVKGETDAPQTARTLRLAIERKQEQMRLEQMVAGSLELSEELESRVAERTLELRLANEALRKEILLRQEAQKACLEQARFLEEFFRHSISPLAFLDRHFNYIRVNQAYARSCQRGIAEFPGHNHFEFYPDPENKALFEHVVRTKTPSVVAAKPFVFLDHPEWGVTYWDWALVPVLDAEGEVDFLFLSMRDVTKLKRAEEETRAALEYARSLIDASLDPLITVDSAGRISGVNRAAELATGLDRGFLIGGGFTTCFGEQEMAGEVYRKAMQDGVVKECPLTIRHVSGRVMEVLCSATLYRDRDGRAQGVFFAARDVSDLRAAQKHGEEAAGRRVGQ